MTVFTAMLFDAYRELNSKRLFWVILALSIIFVVFYGSIGFHAEGMSMFFGLWNIESELFTKDSPLSRILYRGIFATFIVPIWLAWIATILALISTATIFPDFLANGSIDLVLSKPIGRVRLFAYKYLVSLLFVVLQVTIFCLGVFLCMGLRLSDWEWKIFLAIPIVTVFFSYLFSVCVLIGVWTRSALAALLLTLLLWFSLFAVNQTQAFLTLISAEWQVDIERLDERIASLQSDDREEIIASNSRDIDMLQSQRDELQESYEKLERWRSRVELVKTPLPKTAETINLLNRFLSRSDDVNLMDLMQGRVQQTPSGGFRPETDRQSEAQRRAEQELAGGSVGYIIGSSLAFEAVMLMIACMIFVRRDF